MADFYNLGISCVHCGKELAAKRVYSSISIKGLHSLEYIHAETGLEECWIKKAARPYSGWDASTAFDAAQKSAWEAGDDATA